MSYPLIDVSDWVYFNILGMLIDVAKFFMFAAGTGIMFLAVVGIFIAIIRLINQIFDL